MNRIINGRIPKEQRQKVIKTIIAIFVFSFFSFSLNAKEVSINKAQKLAANFLKQKQGSAEELSLVYSPEQAFYVFSSSNSFVIVSGDDRVQPVLAYSTESTFIERNDKDSNYAANVYGLLAEYEKSILQIKEENTESSPEISQQWQQLLQGTELPKSTTSVVEPLMTTTWGQGWPYNAYCPSTSGGSNGHVWTGCVPTAMAQIIHYINKTESAFQGIGSYAYTWQSWPETSANFGNTTYDMNSMPNFVSDISDSGASEIAKLNYHAAVGCRAMWGAGSTGVIFNHNSTHILCDMPMLALVQNYLPLAAGADFIFKNSLYDTISDTDWQNILRNELENNRVVYYRGGGHAWVCDGVDIDDLFHFNFGWDGDYNGYFSVSSIEPGGMTLHNQPMIIIGLKKNDGSTLVSNTTWTGNMSVDDIVVPDAVKLTIDEGAVVNFSENSIMRIWGNVVCNGTNENYVKLSAENPDLGWNGIDFAEDYLDRMADNDSSRFYFTQIEHSKENGILSSQYGKILIDNCKINDNEGIGAGGIRMLWGVINILNSEFYNNVSESGSGAVSMGINEELQIRILNNYFHDNSGTHGGGLSVSIWSEDVIIKDNVFINNYAGQGAALEIGVGSPKIINCKFLGNETIEQGGRGVFYSINAAPDIVNCLFANNNGYGLVLENSVVNIVNSTIVNNYYKYASGIIFGDNATLYMKNSIVYGNEVENSAYGTQIAIFNTNNYSEFMNSNIQGGQAGFGGPGAGSNYHGDYINNIDEDPLFVNTTVGAGMGYDASLANFNYQNDSPCVNIGLPAVELPETDLLGQPRVFGGRVDLGAIENQNMVAPADIVLYPENLTFINPVGEPDTLLSKFYVINTPEFHIDSLAGLCDPYTAHYDSLFRIYVVQNAAISGVFLDTIQVYTNKGQFSLALSGESGYCGVVKGVWQDSAKVVCDVIIPEGDSLKIMPGTVVSFIEGASMTVHGKLIAAGSDTDSIHFLPSNRDIKWKGLKFIDGILDGNSILAYCTIRNSDGGGISCDNYAQLHIKNSVISNNKRGLSIVYGSNIEIVDSRIEYNYSQNPGAGFEIFSSRPIICRNIIQYNSGVTGGGMHIMGSEPVIVNNIFCNNYASSGGAVHFGSNYSGLKFDNNLIINNQASYGGGILISYGNYIITNNTICNNTGSKGGGIYFKSSNDLFVNSIIYNNQSTEGNQVYLSNCNPSFTYSNIQGGKEEFFSSGSGSNYNGTYENNIDTEPLFVEPTIGAGNEFDASQADFSLLFNSPCKDSGDSTGVSQYLPELDLAGNPRILNQIDMGVYENQQTCYIHDFDCDCDVDIVDVTMVAFVYGANSESPNYESRSDLDNDGDIDIVDVTLVAYNYGWACDSKFQFKHPLINTENSNAILHIEEQTSNDGFLYYDLRVAEVAELGGFEFNLEYNPTEIEILEIQEGEFLGSTGRERLELQKNIDSEAGELHYSITTLGAQSQGASGSGTLLRMKCKTHSSNFSPPTLREGQIVRIDGELIPYEMLSTGLENGFESQSSRIISVSPNPFRGRTTVQYSLEKSSYISFEIYDVYGNHINTVIVGQQKPGEYHLEINQAKLNFGVYMLFYRSDHEIIEVRKIIIEK